MRRLVACIVLAVTCGASSVTLGACGARPAAGPSVSSKPPEPIAAAPAKPATRSPSDGIVKHWPFSSPPRIVAYADVAGFRSAPLTPSIVQAVVQSAAELPGGPAQHDCVAALWRRTSEVALGAGDEGVLAVLRFEGPPPVAVCLAALGGAPLAHVEGASRTLALHEGLVATVDGDVVVLGDPALVASSFTKGGSGGGLADVALGPDAYIAVRIENDDPQISARASLAASSDRFHLGVEGSGPEGFAEMIEHEIGDALGSQVVQSNETLSRLAKEVSVSRLESHLRVAFEVQGPPAEQARDVFAAGTVTIAFARQYLTEAKKAEAREAVTAIGSRVAAWVEGDDPADRADPERKLRWKKKLFSLPPVPGAVPTGAKYRSTLADWAAWDAIHFAMSEPQYYQYEVVATKDGSSAEVIARADLNGDGKVSTIKRVVTIDRAARRMVFSPEVEEGGPDE